MANKRLIDANAYAFSGDLINEPTVDAVEVVRCRDCKWFVPEMVGALDNCKHRAGMITPREDDFCSYGERKEREV